MSLNRHRPGRSPAGRSANGYNGGGLPGKLSHATLRSLTALDAVRSSIQQMV